MLTQSNFRQSTSFIFFYPDESFSSISNETSRYTSQYLDTPVDFEPSSRFLWTDTSPLEIAMGLCQKPAQKKTLTFVRNLHIQIIGVGFGSQLYHFLLLRHATGLSLHFSNIEEQVKRWEDGYKPSQPMRDGINLNVTCLWMKAWLSSRVDLLLDGE